MDREKTKEMITLKAAELFRTRGYDTVSVGEICSQCGVTTGAFYYYFRSKRDVIMNYVYNHYDSEDDFSMLLLTETSRFEQAWIVYRDRNMRRIELGPEALRQYFISCLEVGGNAFDPQYSDWKGARRSTELMLRIIELGQKSGEIRAGHSPEEMHNVFLHAKNSIIEDWAARGGSFDVIGELRKTFETIFAPES